MILQISGRLVNAFIEPQFAAVSASELVTVQFYHFEKLKQFRKKLDGELRFNQHDRYFPFTGYAHFATIWHEANVKHLKPKDLMVNQDFSPEPVAYKWVGIKHEAEEWEDEPDIGEWTGECLAGHIEDIRDGSDIRYDEFFFFPLNRLPHSAYNQKLIGGSL